MKQVILQPPPLQVRPRKDPYRLTPVTYPTSSALFGFASLNTPGMAYYAKRFIPRFRRYNQFRHRFVSRKPTFGRPRYLGRYPIRF